MIICIWIGSHWKKIGYSVNFLLFYCRENAAHNRFLSLALSMWKLCENSERRNTCERKKILFVVSILWSLWTLIWLKSFNFFISFSDGSLWWFHYGLDRSLLRCPSGHDLWPHLVPALYSDHSPWLIKSKPNCFAQISNTWWDITLKKSK